MHDVFLSMVFITFLWTVSRKDKRNNFFAVAVEMKSFLFAYLVFHSLPFSSLNIYLLNKVGGV